MRSRQITIQEVPHHLGNFTNKNYWENTEIWKDKYQELGYNHNQLNIECELPNIESELHKTREELERSQSQLDKSVSVQ